MNLVSVQQYADAIGVKRAAIYSRRKNGTIEFVRRGHFYFIDIDKYPIIKGKAGRPTAAEHLRRKKHYTKTLPR